MDTNSWMNGLLAQSNVSTNIITREWFETAFTTGLLKQILLSGVVVVGAMVLAAVLNRLFRLLADRVNLPRLALTPVRILLRVLIFFVAVLLVLKIFRYDADSVFTVLATVLGLVAIGFVAVWSVLSNFLCTFVLILFKPFAVGDELEFPADSVSGKVVDLTLLFTTLRGAGGEYYQIPNNMFFQKIFKRRIGAEAIALEEQLKKDQPAQ